MKKKQRSSKIKVLFNASVILSGINSPKGGSAKVLGFAKQGIITGVVSEIIIDEVLRHADKFDLTGDYLLKACEKMFRPIVSAPEEDLVERKKRIVTDEGDAHVLASCQETNSKYLVTLDRKHLLTLKGKVKGLTILTPGELIILLKKKK